LSPKLIANFTAVTRESRNFIVVMIIGYEEIEGYTQVSSYLGNLKT
jgi:hypothetical protein